MSDQINIVILAAGKGTRLKVDTPKPLLKALGRPLVDHVSRELADFAQTVDLKASFNFVVGHEKAMVEKHIKNSCDGLDPGHALQSFFDQNPSAWNNKYTLVACADTPLLTSDIFTNLYSELKSKNLDGVAATFDLDNPHGLGRVERGDTGFSIVEEKDATDSQRKIKEVNSALYILNTNAIKSKLSQLDSNNKSGEFYLTDIFSKDANVSAMKFDQAEMFLGVNTMIELERVQKILLRRKLDLLALNGVQFFNSDTVYIEESVEIASGAIIHSNVTLTGRTIIHRGATIENGSVIKDSIIGDDVVIKANSYIEGAVVNPKCAVGPMARLREGTILHESCKIGNFVELKKSELQKGVKVSHLSYVGDTEIGTETNIGCGFISCNYDGAEKHKTKIGKNSFIGSDCQMIAPIEIGDEVFIGSGSTINQNVPDGAFAIARQKQVTKEGAAKRFIRVKKK